MKKRNNNRKKKSEQNSVLIDTQRLLSKDDLIEIQAEAYYRAMRRIEDENKNNDKVQKKMGIFETIKLIFFLVLRPKKLVKKTQNGQLAFGLLTFMSASILWIIGLILQIASLNQIVISCYHYFVQGSVQLIELFNQIPYLLLIVMIGGMFRAASKDIDATQDKQFVFQYVASITGILAFLVAMIALLK